MKIYHIISSIDKSTGGPARSVPLLCTALAGAELDIELITTPSANPVSIAENGHFRKTYKSHAALATMPLKCDLVHLQHIWTPYIHIQALKAHLARKPYIITPRGMLEPWIMAHNPLRKKMGMWLYQRADLDGAACLHATCEAEKQQFRGLGFRNPVAVIPNGLRINDIPYREMDKNTRKIVFLSRIHPKKGIELLLEAWKELDTAGWTLEIAGEGEADYIKSLAAKIKNENIESVQLVGGLYGHQKWDFLASAELMILPTHSENFGMVVAEALAMGVPVITTFGTPWEELTTYNCGWWIKLTVANLKQSLHEAITLDAATRKAMGQRGRRLMQDNYDINAIAIKMKSLYNWILGLETKPAFVTTPAEELTLRKGVVHFLTSIDRKSGGTAAYMKLTAPPLCKHIALQLVTGKCNEPVDLQEVKIHFLNLTVFRYFQLRAEFRKLLLEINPALVHVNAIWQPQTWWFQQVAQELGIPVVLSPHGMLEPWILARHPWRKRIALMLYQRRAVSAATALHATAPQELEQFRKLGFTNPAFVVPNGVELSEIKPKTEWKRVTNILFLSRVHPKKGIDILIEAIANLGNPNLKITIAGEGEAAYIEKLKQLAAQRGVAEQFHFVGGVYGDAKWQLYHQADLFVLPTYSENFGIVVAEALFTGLPVITTTGTPWRELESEQCGWWIDLNATNLAKAIDEASQFTPDELKQMGLNGRKLVAAKYDIKAVALAMNSHYEELLSEKSLSL